MVKGFIVSDLYVTIEPAIEEAGESSQHTVLNETIDKHIDPIPLQSYQEYAENTGDGYGSKPWQTFPHVNSIEEEEGPHQVHEGEHLSHDRGTPKMKMIMDLVIMQPILMLLGMTSRSY